LVRIEANAFQGCSALRSICIPASVEVLSKECLATCIRLLVISFESDSHLKRIDHRAFEDCKSLKSIFIPRSVESIGHWCFARCDSLDEVTFECGSKLIRIGEFPFADCKSLKCIHIQTVDGNSVEIPSTNLAMILRAIREGALITYHPHYLTSLSADNSQISSELRPANLRSGHVDMVWYRRKTSFIRQLPQSAVFSTPATDFSDVDFMLGYDQFLNVNC
jgi:hypothetical protein